MTRRSCVTCRRPSPAWTPSIRSTAGATRTSLGWRERWRDPQPSGRRPSVLRAEASTCGPARSATCTKSTTRGSFSSRRTGSAPSTSSCPPRSRTRAGSSPGCHASGSGSRPASSRTAYPRHGPGRAPARDGVRPGGRGRPPRPGDDLPRDPCPARRMRGPGVPERLGLEEYQVDRRGVRDRAPPGLRESDRLAEPIFAPAWKAPAGVHDENIPLPA